MLISLGCRAFYSSPVSVGTFFKHLPALKPSTLKFSPIPAIIAVVSLSCTSAATSDSASLINPHFETLTSHQKHQVRLYIDSLLQWNQKMNLTAVKEETEVMERHVEDSLAIIDPIRKS